MTAIDVGVLTIGAEGQRIDSGASREAVFRENELLALVRDLGFSAVPGGAPFPEEERIATTSPMIRHHVHTLMDAHVACTIVNVTEGARGSEVVAGVSYLERELKRPSRLLVYADRNGNEAAVRSWLAVRAALERQRMPYLDVFGEPRDDATRERLRVLLTHLISGARTRDAVLRAALHFKKQKLLVFGPAGSRLTHEMPDPVALARDLGVELAGESLLAVAERQQALAGPDGTSRDLRVRALAEHDHASSEDAVRYHAILDLIREHDATAAVLPEVPGFEKVARWLSDDHGPDGEPKDCIPAATGGEHLLAVSQLTLSLLASDVSHTLRWIGKDSGRVRARGLSTDWTGEMTLLRWVRSGRSYAMHVAEGIAAPVATGHEIEGPNLDSWPAPSAAVVSGRRAGTLAELGRELRQDRVWHGVSF